jgi:uncharacterized membrane protein (DUF373 family)
VLAFVNASRKQLALVSLELFDNVIDFAVQCRWDIAATIANAVIGYAVLREVISADFLRSIARPDQTTAFGS